tara:strand:+ start:1405 stop:2004 length:600 start_codon:yes stop_codon:yes gene_type:complete
MKFYINRQESYSRGHLLLRTFFGGLYIGLPHGILLFFLLIGYSFVSIITFWIVLFTGKYPDWSWNYGVKLMNYSLRVNAALSNLSDIYPAFGLGGTHPHMNFDLPFQENQSRGRLILRTLLGSLMLIPHYFILFFLGIAVYFVGLAAFFTILFTGKYPEGMFNFVVTTMRWSYRVKCWYNFLTDGYPPFTGNILESENK